jgi:HK97 family phage major capsid protein
MADTKIESPSDEVAEPRTRAEILAALDDFDGAVKALNEKGLDKLTDEEAKDLEAFLDARDELRDRLKTMPSPAALKARIDAGASAVRRPHLGGVSSPGTGTAVDVKADRIDNSESELEKFTERGPFKSFGHFSYAVYHAGDRPGRSTGGIIGEWAKRCTESDNAIKALYGDDYKAVTGLNEFAEAEGGVLVPLTFASGIWKRSIDEDFNILSLMRTIPVTGNSLTVRARNDKTRASGNLYGGVTAYWRAEGDQLTNVKPTYRSINLRLEKLTCLIPATEEMLEDVAGAEAEISDTAAGAIRFKVNDAMFRGTGVGMPLGFMNAACKVTVTSNNGASSTISATDVDNMFARRAKASGNGLVWLVNQDTEPQLAQLAYTVANTAATFAYVPGTSLASGISQLKGKPVYYTEFNETLGTEGDIILLDPMEYVVAVKSTGIKASVSAHLRFDYDESVFKYTLRMDARPYWDASLTRFKGSNALSPVVTLESTRNS